MKRYIFLAIVVAFALIGVHNVYADGPPSTLSQEAQARYDALPADVQRELDDQMRTIPAEDWEQLVAVTVGLYDQNTNNYTFSSGGCSVSASLWRSYSANRMYGSILASCSQRTSWIAANAKLDDPGGGHSYAHSMRYNTSAVMATASDPYQPGFWRVSGTGNFPHWNGSASASGNY